MMPEKWVQKFDTDDVSLPRSGKCFCYFWFNGWSKFSANQKHHSDLGVMIHQYGISALVPQTSFCRETSGGVTKCWLQSQANNNWFHHKNCIWEMRVTKCWLQYQANYWRGKVWNGWFQKISIPYHRWHEYFNPPLPSEIPKCLSSPCPPNSKIANPPSPPEFSTFVSDPLEFLFVCLNLQTNEKLALFPSAKEFCSQFLVRRSSKS